MSFSVKEDLEDKNRQIKNMVAELSKIDTELQQTKQDLQHEQIQNNDYESQVCTSCHITIPFNRYL
jgi:chromosome segregation ATPase